MKFPYGISNFYHLITEGYYYQDRTDYLPLLEVTGKQLLFLRPRRFGKSLLLSPTVIIEQLVDHFGLEDLLSADQDTRFLVSWCYFFGILTLAGEDDLSQSRFKIPNLVVRQLYLERLQQEVFFPT